MNTQYLDFWQNTFSGVFSKEKQFESMDKLVRQSLSNFEEFASLIQKFSELDTFGPSFKYLNMIGSASLDFTKTYQDYLKILGMVSIDEYRSLVKKYEELAQENDKLKKAQKGQTSKSTELSKTITSQKKKLTSMEKTIDGHKNKLAEQKKVESSLKKELTKSNQLADKLKNELTEVKSLSDSLKNEITEKDKTIKKLNTKEK